TDEVYDHVQHPVTLTRGFWMGVYPVTQCQWRDVMGNNPSCYSRHGGHKDRVVHIADADLDRFPVEEVSWDDAQEFCAPLSERRGGTVRLPTEAEWEYACRAGTTSRFHFGPGCDGTQANCNGELPCGSFYWKRGPFLNRTTAVGSYPPNAWGLYD